MSPLLFRNKAVFLQVGSVRAMNVFNRLIPEGVFHSFFPCVFEVGCLSTWGLESRMVGTSKVVSIISH